MYNNFNDSVLHIVISIIQRSALHDTKQFCQKIKQKTLKQIDEMMQT